MELTEIGNILNMDLFLRIICALLLGSFIGLEREITNKYAGLRTNILVCVGACIFTIISIYGFPIVPTSGDEFGTRDTARVAAQVVTGIGFVGGGAVLRHGATILGLTTAATLWIAASIGMACGAGMYGLAAISTALTLIVLISARIFERSILTTSTKNTKRLKVCLSCNNEIAGNVYDSIIENFGNLKEISKKLNKNDDNLTRITVIFDISSKNPIKSIYKKFQQIEGIESISVQEFNELV